MRRSAIVMIGAVVALSGAALLGSHRAGAETPVPAPKLDEAVTAAQETTVLAGGCFWGVQGVFQHVRGVQNAVSGYTGGPASQAQYDTVSTGTTGAAESVRITFDPRQISYGQLLRIYFSVAHDPTELNEQGPDEGTQYRSAIFAQTPAQAKVAAAYISQLNASHVFGGKVVTTVEPGKTFYQAENYHQNFLYYNPAYPYIAFNDLPKVRALRQAFPGQYRADPVLVPGITKAEVQASN